jgi:hypothetical protein
MFEKKDKIEGIFIFIYFFEQVALIALYIFVPKLLPFWIGVFPVIFLTTIAFEKVFMKADFQTEKRDLENQLKEKNDEEKDRRRFMSFRDEFRRNKFLHRKK